LKRNQDKEALRYLCSVASTLHPHLAAALVVAATPIFEEKASNEKSSKEQEPITKAAILKNEKMSGTKYIQALQQYIGYSNPEANKAISRLKNLLYVKPGV
jgi:uncharacterized protein YdaL